MERCKLCGYDKEKPNFTAYLVGRKKESGLCRDCSDRLEQEDLDEHTYDILSTLCDIMNGGSSKRLAQSLFRAITRQHRYLQNELFMSFAQFFKQYGQQDETQRDARNEWAVKVAKIWGEES